MRIALLGATFETSNLGVSALTAGAVTCLRHAFPAAEVSLLDYGKEGRNYSLRVEDHDVEVRLVNLRFSKKFWLPNNVAWLILPALVLRLLPFGFVRRSLVKRNAWLRHMEDTELFAAISGGDSFSDIYGLERLLYVALPQILVILLDKRLVLLPQTLGPYKGRFARSLARYILRRAELVYSRDHAGVETAGELLGAKAAAGKVRFCNDVAFVMEPHSPAKTDIAGLAGGTGPLVGMNISGLLAMGGYTGKNMFGLGVDYNGLVQRLIDFFIQVKGARVLLVPHVFGSHAESDVMACEKTYDSLRGKYPGQLGRLRGTYDQHEIKHIIGGCDFFVGSRMHACIAAISQAVPAVAIAYSAKFRGVMETVGAAEMVADPRVMREEEILRIVDRTFERRAAIRRELQSTIPAVQATVLSLFETVTGEHGGVPTKDEALVDASVSAGRN
jgi:polysaccharide pyruvyl transferase WcaK-like protein